MSASIAADRARTNADARLVALARESRGEALELMYSAYKSRIYTFLLRLLSDPVGADDLTQDVFTKAYQALGSLTTEHRVLPRSEEHTSELQSHVNLVCRLLL